MKQRIVALVAIALLVLIGYGLYTRYWSGKQGQIQVSGNIEATTVDVSFKIPGRVVARLVDEGAVVKKGQLIAKLDATQLVDAVNANRGQLRQAEAALAELRHGSRPEEVASAKAAYERAQFALIELLNGSRPEEIRQAREAVRQARASAQDAYREYLRQKDLYGQGYVSLQQYENAETTQKTTDALLRQALEHWRLVKIGPRYEEIQQARKNAAQAKEQYVLVKKGPRIEEIEQGRARVEAALASLSQSEAQLKDATLFAPLSGVVLSKNVEPGEYVSAGTALITVGDLQNVWLRAYVDESDIGKVKSNQPADITTDSYPEKIYPGHVSFISAEPEFTPKNIQTQKERVKLVYRIKIDIANPKFELKPGMPADAKLK